jgi:hypothetical protein
MKTIIQIFVLACAVSLAGCEKTDDSAYQINGTWIELNNHSDTISFEDLGSEGMLTLKRGYEYVNGHLLPKYGSGMYQFKLKPDTIMINNILWNCLCYPSYDFQMNSMHDTFEIGNFYDTSLIVNQRMTFFRI